jgi:hypothetical protein
MESQPNTTWTPSLKIKLLAPIAIAAALLIAANLFHPKEEEHQDTLTLPFTNISVPKEIKEAVVPRVKRTGTFLGWAWDTANDYCDAATKGFNKNPKGELNRQAFDQRATR